jgi:hypothetical protein
MTNPDDPAWLQALLRRSILVPAAARRHWQRLLPFLSTVERYELAATLLEAERWIDDEATFP